MLAAAPAEQRFNPSPRKPVSCGPGDTACDVLHRKKQVIVEPPKPTEGLDKADPRVVRLEDEANRFAARTLIPQRYARRLEQLPSNEIPEFANRLGIGSEQAAGEGSDEPPPRPRLLGDEAERFRQDRPATGQAVAGHRRRRLQLRLDGVHPLPARPRPHWRSWLITTAQREAWRLHGKETGHVGFEVEGARDEML
ncbi:MAG TPA: hypothetical protein VFX80_12775, partial [Solirubrobacteraceae bacterium]|nr:hypothetical protein [Solirubrobacteraceae bacterium]